MLSLASVLNWDLSIKMGPEKKKKKDSGLYILIEHLNKHFLTQSSQ